MKKNYRYIQISLLLFISLFLLITEIVPGANPTVGEIILVPAHPAPKSDVTISTDISGNSVSKVRLIINECNKETGVCYAPRNISMNKKNGDTFEAKITLQWDDVTSITYHIKLESGGKWIDYDEYTTLLSISSGNSNDTNGSPGFEIILFLFAVIGFIIFFKKFKSNF